MATPGLASFSAAIIERTASLGRIQTPRLRAATFVLAGLLAAWGVPATEAAPYVFINIEVPFPGARATILTAINDSRQVVGWYLVGTGQQAAYHAFEWDQGEFTMLDPPGAVAAQAHDINDAGQVVGHYIDANKKDHAFLWSEGTFTTIDPPGATYAVAHAINAGGQIVGSYGDGCCCGHGFLWDQGTFTTIDAIACSEFFPVATEATGINAAGQIIGGYVDESETGHGFLFDNGTFSTIDAPSATVTRLNAINDSGEMVGSYSFPDPFYAIPSHHAFLWDNGFTNIDPPDAVADPDTRLVAVASDINAAGVILGDYRDAAQKGRIFLLRDGVFTKIDGPTSGDMSGSRINLASDVIGGYSDSSGNHSFVARPASVVNQFVRLVSLTQTRIPTAAPGGLAGTTTIRATFKNSSSTSIEAPFFIVTDLSGGNVLLNADGGPGGVGKQVDRRSRLGRHPRAGRVVHNRIHRRHPASTTLQLLRRCVGTSDSMK